MVAGSRAILKDTLSATHIKAFEFNDLEAFCFWDGNASGSQWSSVYPIVAISTNLTADSHWY